MSKTYSAGIVTAYGAAKRAGYQGTYEDFCRQQAGYAESAAAVEQAKTTAVNAATTATTKAGEATTAATAAQTAKTQTEQAASQALTDIEAARTGAISAVQTEGATQTANARTQAQAAAASAATASTKASEASASATSAGLSATNAAESATSAAQSASDAQDVLDSIPADYSDLSANVSQLQADLEEQSEIIERLNDGGLDIKDEVIKDDIEAWLTQHPEATTTVQDGSLTEIKFSDALKNKTIKDYLIPEMFGAVGYAYGDDMSNPTDSSQAFQQMLNSAEYDMPILIPAKTYFVKNLELPNRVTICGTGKNSIIKLHPSAATNDYILHESDTSYGHCTIKDLVLDGNKDNVTGVCNGITNGGVSGGYAKYYGNMVNVIFRNFTGRGLYYTNNAMEYTFENCRFIGNAQDGAYFNNLTDSRITNCSFSSNGSHGLYLKGSTTKMLNSKCYMNGTYNSGAGLHLEGIHHTITNVEIQENYNDGAVFANLYGSNITINANNNNHRDNVGGAQMRVTGCKNNIFNVVLSGGYMTGNVQPIVEKNGIVEVGAGNTNNRYIAIENSKQYRDTNQTNVMNLISSEYEQLSNMYMLNNDNWFNDHVNFADFNTNTVTLSFVTDGTATVLDDGDAIKCTGTSQATPANGVVMRVRIYDIFSTSELQKIKAGDVLFCDGYMKNADGFGAYFFVQEVVDGAYISLTTVSNPKTFANSYDKISGIYTFPKGYDDATNTFVLQIGINFQTLSAISAGVSLETFIKKCKFKVQHK